ncbi:hypothetical protein QMK19_23325 [Streptomyces sp. H10-C2]|uniref:hypothetical protein n=1 Tax=unclassified Streptomyces TaxID=2593676 RepID=UPI0024BA25B4|nr:MULTISPECIES: hypothetical protein [unclassified Streptomyces]MDJ0342839.1 hypothetical protein [Streptomyces sp. PH10-H1]MDJ0372517.1 hypothetical protein [Streptomyces sp. H10-C2]
MSIFRVPAPSNATDRRTAAHAGPHTQTHRTLPVGAALVVATTLALTGCASSDKASGKHPAATTIAPSASAAIPSASATDAGAPKFDLPPDVHVVIDGFDSNDPTKKAALRDTSYAINAVLEAESRIIVKETPNFARYFTGLQGAQFADTIIEEARTGEIITGTYRYYQSTVKIVNAGVTNVAYCEDQRKGFSKVAKTGRVLMTTPSLQDFRRWSMTLVQNTAGDWQVLRYTWTLGAKECQIA